MGILEILKFRWIDDRVSHFEGDRILSLDFSINRTVFDNGNPIYLATCG